MKLRWTNLAVDHLRSAWEFIAFDNPAAADQLVARIVSAVDMLQLQPYLGRKGRVPGTRELVIAGTPFAVPYRVRENRDIEIIAVLHGARRWPEAAE